MHPSGCKFCVRVGGKGGGREVRLKKRGFDAWDVSPVGPGFDGAKRLRGWEKRCLVKQIRCCYQVCRSQLMLREKVSFYVLLLPFFSFNARFLVFLYLFCIEVYQYFPLGCFLDFCLPVLGNLI